MSATSPTISDTVSLSGSGTTTGFAGHAGVTANSQLTFHLGHSVGSVQDYVEPGSIKADTASKLALDRTRLAYDR